MFLDTVNRPPHRITTAAETEDGRPSQTQNTQISPTQHGIAMTGGHILDRRATERSSRPASPGPTGPGILRTSFNRSPSSVRIP